MGVGERSLSRVERLKVSCLAEGIRIEASAEAVLSEGGRVPLTLHEYATTGGVTLRLADDVYVNAPFDEPWNAEAPARLWADEAGALLVEWEGVQVPVAHLPLPGFLGAKDATDRPITDVAMSHADRVRLSPVWGCSYSCRFCDLAGIGYRRRPTDQLLEALDIASRDCVLPVRHALVSGGTPSPRDEAWFIDACAQIARRAPFEVDVMMTPLRRADWVDRLVEAGIHGFAINLEVFRRDGARNVVPQKARLGLDAFEAAIRRAVQLTGGNGRVRSLLLVGLEDEADTLAGVEFLAQLGCDPVLSPFRPARGTAMADHAPPTVDLLTRVHAAAAAIARKHGVRLGPRCGPCQHNTMTMPRDVDPAG